MFTKRLALTVLLALSFGITSFESGKAFAASKTKASVQSQKSKQKIKKPQKRPKHPPKKKRPTKPRPVKPKPLPAPLPTATAVPAVSLIPLPDEPKDLYPLRPYEPMPENPIPTIVPADPVDGDATPEPSRTVTPDKTVTPEVSPTIEASPTVEVSPTANACDEQKYQDDLNAQLLRVKELLAKVDEQISRLETLLNSPEYKKLKQLAEDNACGQAAAYIDYILSLRDRLNNGSCAYLAKRAACEKLKELLTQLCDKLKNGLDKDLKDTRQKLLDLRSKLLTLIDQIENAKGAGCANGVSPAIIGVLIAVLENGYNQGVAANAELNNLLTDVAGANAMCLKSAGGR